MSVPYLRDAVKDRDSEKLIRFVRLHLGDGNENVGPERDRKVLDRSPEDSLYDQEPDCDFIEQTMQKDSSTLVTRTYKDSLKDLAQLWVGSEHLCS
jgi:hypothetical protein